LDNRPKIAIIENQEIFRIGLAELIKQFEFVKFAFEAFNSEDFFARQEVNNADILLMNDSLPATISFDIIYKARELYPGLKIIVFTSGYSHQTLNKIVEAGVEGYLLKSTSRLQLETAIKSILAGENYYSPELIRYITSQIRFSAKIRKKNLSKRESEVLQLIFEGFTNQEIAKKLFISVRTVSNHRLNMKTRLGVKNTAALITFGLQQGIIKTP